MAVPLKDVAKYWEPNNTEKCKRMDPTLRGPTNVYEDRTRRNVLTRSIFASSWVLTSSIIGNLNRELLSFTQLSRKIHFLNSSIILTRLWVILKQVEMDIFYKNFYLVKIMSTIAAYIPLKTVKVLCVVHPAVRSWDMDSIEDERKNDWTHLKCGR